MANVLRQVGFRQRFEPGAVVDDLCYGVPGQHFLLQLEHDEPAVPIHAEQIENSAVGRRLTAHQRQARHQHVRIPDQQLLQQLLRFHPTRRFHGCRGFRRVVDLPYPDVVAHIRTLHFLHWIDGLSTPGSP